MMPAAVDNESSLDAADALERNEDSSPLITVEGLSIEYFQGREWTGAVNDVSFSVNPGEVYGIVGESGCGKTTVLRSILGYRHPASRVRQGRITYRGQDVLEMSTGELRGLRGRHIAYVPQNPGTSLTPSMRVGNLLVESLLVHSITANRREALERTIDLFERVGLPEPDKTALKYPHQLSGGQQQRVVIAMALACNPDLLLLDEPTTGLDVTTQSRILRLLVELREEFGISMVYVTHNLAVVAAICDRIGVMYAGDLVEDGPTRQVFNQPRHPYTHGLIASIPRLSGDQKLTAALRGMLVREQLPPGGCKFAPRCDFAQERCRTDLQVLERVTDQHRVACWRSADLQLAARDSVDTVAAVKSGAGKSLPGREDHRRGQTAVKDLDCAYVWERGRFFIGKRPIPVVRGVSFDIAPGETVGLVGESGSGKSTIAKAMSGLMAPTNGEILLDDELLERSSKRRPRSALRRIQFIMQNPDASLNPRQRVESIVGRPLKLFFGLSGNEMRARVLELLEDVHLDQTYLRRFPGEMSGGERQRIAIARALAAEPDLLLCDEIVSALDVSVQAGVLELLQGLQEERGIAFLFISHDLAVVRSVSDRVAVLYGGEVMEFGVTAEIYRPPYHPYTHVLLSAVLDIEPGKPIAEVRGGIEEEVDSDRQPACAFARTCPWKVGTICDDEEPPHRQVSETHYVRCHIPLEELLDLETAAGLPTGSR